MYLILIDKRGVIPCLLVCRIDFYIHFTYRSTCFALRTPIKSLITSIQYITLYVVAYTLHDTIRYQYNLLYILLFIINSKGMLTRGINVRACARVCNYINQLHTCNRIAVCNRLLSARKSLKISSEFLKSIPPVSKKIRFLFAPTLVKLLYNPQITDICVVFLILCRSYVDF